MEENYWDQYLEHAWKYVVLVEEAVGMRAGIKMDSALKGRMGWEQGKHACLWNICCSQAEKAYTGSSIILPSSFL